MPQLLLLLLMRALETLALGILTLLPHGFSAARTHRLVVLPHPRASGNDAHKRLGLDLVGTGRNSHSTSNETGDLRFGLDKGLAREETGAVVLGHLDAAQGLQNASQTLRGLGNVSADSDAGVVGALGEAVEGDIDERQGLGDADDAGQTLDRGFLVLSRMAFQNANGCRVWQTCSSHNGVFSNVLDGFNDLRRRRGARDAHNLVHELTVHRFNALNRGQSCLDRVTAGLALQWHGKGGLGC